METPLVHAYALPAGIGFLPTFFSTQDETTKKKNPEPSPKQTRAHTPEQITQTGKKKKKGENQEWQTKDSSQFSLAQLRQDRRGLFNHQVQAAPPALEQAGAAS